MKNSNKKRPRDYSKKLIQNATKAELILKNKLTELNFFFYFQKPHPRGTFKKGFFIPDFTFIIKTEYRRNYLFVEIDGGYHFSEEQIRKDKLREKRLIGYYKHQLIRFTNDEVITNVDNVIKKISEFAPWKPGSSYSKRGK